MVPNHKPTPAGTDAKPVPPASTPLHNLVLLVRDDAIRSVRAIDHLLDLLYLPAEVQEQRKKCAPDEADAIRLHALGVRW
jgi:hypothetical protein